MQYCTTTTTQQVSTATRANHPSTKSQNALISCIVYNLWKNIHIHIHIHIHAMNSNYNQFNKTNQIPVVQGQTISASVYDHSAGYAEIQKGEHQPKRFNDVFWGFLFYAHIVAMVVLAIVYMPQLEMDFDYYNRRALFAAPARAFNSVSRSLASASTSTSNAQHRMLEDNGGDPNGVFLLVGLSVVVAFLLSIVSLTLMINFAEGLIKMSLFFNMFLGIVTATAGFMVGSMESGIMGLVLFLIAACYAWAVWSRIPFAATNLVTASTAIQANMGVTFFAYSAIVVNGLWLVLWSASTYSTIFVIGGCNANGECQNDINPFYVFLFVLSLYWTMQVIKNVVHVTVAGTVGTWWWSPSEASGCCSKAVRESHNRALTYSFGSICLGSLLVAIIQAIKSFVESAREQDDSLLRCLADCLLGCLETLMEMFNEWAFVYVGLYGYSFTDAARNVITLFKTRGWTTIITDYMVDRVLMMISVGNGLVAGGCAALISYMFNLNLEGVAFTVGFVVGLVLTSVVLGVVGSAVNTVIVCYAEDPAAFETNHFDLSVRMRESWREAFPNDFTY